MSEQRFEVSTVVYLPPEEVYEFLLDFPRYARYSKYLTEIQQHGDGLPPTEYRLQLEWWKLSYLVHTRVTDVEQPSRIDWEIIKDIDATGKWSIEHVPDAAPDDAESASRVRLIATIETTSIESSIVDTPAFVPFDRVLDKLKPKLIEEAERVVERIVADLEGSRRDIDLQIHETPFF